MTLLGSVDIPFTKSTKIAVDATDTAGQAQATAQTASQTATQAAATATGAAQAAQTAITTANGKNKAYYGATTPTSPQPGDIWFVEDGNNNVTAIKHYDGTQWITDVDNTALAQQISAAQAAADKAATVGQAAQQTAADAEAKGDAAVQAAGEAKDAATKAQTDAADAVTSANNAVNTANKATQDAQDAIDKAQDGFDAAQNALSVANSAASTASDASQVANDAATQSSNAWTKAQDAMAEAQKKADATSVYTKTDIDNALKGYATTTTVNTLTGRVDSAETAIQQNTNAIQLKADKSTVDTLTGRVSTAEATLKTQADQIAARITKTDADAKYATQTALTATANSLTSNISAVQTNLDNLQIGARNLLKNSDDFSEFRVFINDGSGGTVKLAKSNELYKGYQTWTITNTGTGDRGILRQIGGLENGKDYTVSFYYKIPAPESGQTYNYGNGLLFIVNHANSKGLSSGNNPSTSELDGNWHRMIAAAKPVDSGFTIRIDVGNIPTLQVALIQVEEGNKATDWTPAPEDMATVVQFNTLSQTLDSTVSRIGNAEGNISALQQTSDSFATRISNAEGNISSLTQTTNGLQTTVSGKVDKTTYNSFVAQTNTALQSKLSVQDAANTYATQSNLTQTASSLTSKITSVQTNLDNLQVGGRNLVPNSTGLLINPDGRTAQFWQGGTISHKNADGTTSLEVINSGTSESMRSGTVFNVEPNTTYIFRAKIKGSTNSTTMDVYFLGSKTAKTGIGGSYDYIHLLATGTTNKNDWQEYITKFTTNSDEICGYVRIDNNASSDGSSSSVYFSQIKLEKGTKATDWSPAPEDMATQSQISQLADDINLRVQKGDVINQINVSTEGILIDGKKVHITGQTTIDNAVIKDAMIQSMTANKLTAGTIDANVINVTNINASNIVTGTLDASKATVTNIDASKITTGTLNAARIAAGSIDASKLNVSSLSALSANLGNVTAGNISGVNINIGNGNFTVDTSGNLVAKNANITGTINATSGTFSGSVNVISTVTNPWGNYDTVKINPTYRFPIHIDDDESRHTYLSSGIVEIYYPGFSDTNTVSAKTTIEPSLITFSENDKVVSQITANAIYSIDYYNGKSTITSNGNAQFGNINLNGYHSIISNDGDALFFTNANGDRIDINANWVRPNNMAFGYHTIASLDGKKLFFTSNTSNGKRIDIGIATLDYSGSLSKSSSEAIKANIMPMNFSALDEIMKTDFYSYNYISDLERGVTKPNFGPVIGDSYRLSDKFLTQDEKSISIDSMTAINSQAIKELYESMQKQNQQIVLKIADLELELANLKQKLGDA